MISESQSNCCLFCAASCSPNFTINNGKLTRLKVEKGGRGKSKLSSRSTSTSQFLKEEENPLLAQQLRVIFILKNILKIKNEKLISFLGKLDGNFNPECWISLCDSCGAAVRQYFKIFKEVTRLQMKLSKISKDLRTRIDETRDAHEDDEDTEEYETETDETCTNTWKEIRQEVMKQNGAEAKPETTITSTGKASKSTEILLEGDINAAWDEEEGILSLDVPDLASLKQILGLDLESESEEVLSHRKVSIQEKRQPNSNETEEWEDNVNSPLQSDTQSNSEHHFSRPSSPTPSSSSALRKLQQKRQQKRLRRHNNKARFGYHACDQCPFSSRRLPALKLHQEIHNPNSNVETVTCPICKWVLHPMKLWVHNKYYHPSEIPENEDGKKQRINNRYFKCPECGALFTILKYLRDHMKLHEKGEGITCTECGWLTNHLKNHLSNWHSPEGSSMSEIRRRMASTYRIYECTFLKIEKGPKSDTEAGENDNQ